MLSLKHLVANITAGFTLVLSSPGPARATDAGIIAAALPNEEAECRYLVQLKQQHDLSQDAVNAYSALANAKGKTGNALSIYEAMMLYEKERVDFDAYKEALFVVISKHEKRPTCFNSLSRDHK